MPGLRIPSGLTCALSLGMAAVILLSSVYLPVSGHEREITSSGTFYPVGATSHAWSPLLTLRPSPHIGPIYVGPGQVEYVNGSPTDPVFIQQGNVDVSEGGLLVIQNITFEVAEPVGESSLPLASRLAGLASFEIQGDADLRNATLTTAVLGVSDFPKLSLGVSGTLSLFNSSFEFPGWLSVSGPHAELLLNRSSIGPSRAAAESTFSNPILGDISFAPVLSVSDGGTLDGVASNLVDLYRDNLTENGTPGMKPIVDSQAQQVSPSSGAVYSNFTSPNDTESLIQDLLNPINFTSVSIAINYSLGAGYVVTDVWLTYFGENFDLGNLTLLPTPASEFYIPLTPSAVAWLSSIGSVGLLQSTRSFGSNATNLTTHLYPTGVGTGIATVTSVGLSSSPTLQYNFSVGGKGSNVSLLDSSIGVNWLDPALAASNPWISNKLQLTNQSEGWFANVSTISTLPRNPSSPVTANGGAVAYLLGWTSFTAGGPAGPLVGAHLSAYSNLSGIQNRTANSVNRLQQANPWLARTADWEVAAAGSGGYGVTAIVHGEARGYLLLASSIVEGNSSQAPTGLEFYRVQISVSAQSLSTGWNDWNSTSYPAVLLGAAPALAPKATFPQFVVQLSVVNVSADAGEPPTIDFARIGQEVTVHAAFNVSGLADVNVVSSYAQLLTPFAPRVTVARFPTVFGPIVPGEVANVSANWNLTEAIVGAHGSFDATITVVTNWTGGPTNSTTSSSEEPVEFGIRPSVVSLAGVMGPATSTLDSGGAYWVNGTVAYNGSGAASIKLFADYSAGGVPTLLDELSVGYGPFNFSLVGLLSELAGNGPFKMSLVAEYNTQNSTGYTLATTYTVVANSTQGGATPPWWIFAVLLAGVAATFAALVVRRRLRGKMIECGECASLVPDRSQRCPTCGTTFEIEESRCVQCGGPVPAGADRCPECHHVPADRPLPPSLEADREAFAKHLEDFRAAAQGELGDDYPEVEFWRWWRKQPAYQSFRDWQEGRTPKPTLEPPDIPDTTPPEEGETGT